MQLIKSRLDYLHALMPIRRPKHEGLLNYNHKIFLRDIVRKLLTSVNVFVNVFCCVKRTI